MKLKKHKKLLVVGVIVAALVILPTVLKADNETIKAIKAHVRQVFSLDDEQVRSMNAIFDAFERYGDGDPRKLGYILATAWHESRLRPIREIKASEGTTVWEQYQKKYWYTGFYGRGFVQLTWEDNYRRMGDALGYDLVGNPDLALRTDVAAKIICLGMMKGMFTGKRLSDYIEGTKEDFYNARRVVGAIYVDGKDTAALIQSHVKQIYTT